MSELLNIKDLLRELLEGVLGTRHSSGDPEDDAQSVGGFRRRLVLDAFNYFLSKVVPGLMGFLSVLVFVRMVGVEQYGRYAVAFAFVMASASGLAGWLSQGILRFQSQSREPADAENFLRSAVIGTVLSVAGGMLALGIAIPAFGVQRGWPLVLSLALFAAVLIYTVTLARFQASLRSAQVLRFEVVRAAGGFLIPIALMWAIGSRDYRLLLSGIALGYALPLFEPVLARAKSHAESAHHSWLNPSSSERKVLAQLWTFGWPVALWVLCQQLMLVSDRFFLQRFVGYSGAGIYASMYDTVVRSFSLFFMPVTLAVHPLVMNRWNSGSRRHALRAIRAGMMCQVLMFVPIVAVLVVLAPWVGRLVLGNADPQAASIVLPLALSGFLWQVCLLAHKPLEILCRTRRMLVGIVVALAVNVAGNWLLVPIYGYCASAYLTVASSVSYLLLLLALTPLAEFRKETAMREMSAASVVAVETMHPAE